MERSFFCQYHPDLGWVNRPNYRGVVKGKGVEFIVTQNPRGLRGREHPYERTPGKKRIVVLGDSFAWGFGVGDGEVFTEFLEATLPDLEVVNMGVSGYGTDQEILLYDLEGNKYNPDLVVLVFCSNDLDDISTSINFGYPKPVFLPGTEPLTTANIPVPRTTETERLFGNPATPAGKIGEYLRRHTHTYPFLEARLNSVPWGRKLLLGTGLTEKPVEDLPGVPHMVLKDQGERWGLFFRLVKELRSMADEQGAGLLLVHVPQKEAPYREKAVAERNAGSNDEYSSVLGTFAARNGIPFIDMLPAIREGEARGVRYYNASADDIHLNAEGHRLLARAIIARLTGR